MNRTKIVLYGASGHGRVVADLISKLPRLDLVGFVDDDTALAAKRIGKIPVLGGSEVLGDLHLQGVTAAVVTIGQNAVRTRKARELGARGFELVAVVHPAAVLAADVHLGGGSVVAAGAVVNTGTHVGNNVIINTGATIDHDCFLDDGCHVSPGAHLAGGVRLGKEAHVGIGCNIIQDVTVGTRSVIGAGAAVISDIPPGETWVGNPARSTVRSEVFRNG